MITRMLHWIVFAFLVWRTECRDPRSVIELTKCVRIAEPLIHDPSFVFPLSTTEISSVCEMWDKFAQCVREYTSTFLTQQQLKEFEKAISPSMQSIHQLCTEDKHYQTAYLKYAPCMKMIATDPKHCGGHYNFLARIAESSSESSLAICCGYHKFRSCALQEATKECDSGIEPSPTAAGESSHFVSSMLNRALGFLLQKCSHYEPKSQDCSLLVKGNRDLHSYSGVSTQDLAVGDTPWNVADLLPSSNKDPTYPSVTIKPRPLDNTFTWNPIPAGSFFPTDVNNHISGPKSQEFRGEGSSANSLQSPLLPIVIATFILSILF